MLSQSQLTIAELTATHLYVWRGVLGSEATQSAHVCRVEIKGVEGAQMQDMDDVQSSINHLQSQWKSHYSCALTHIDHLCISPTEMISLRTQGMTEIRQDRVAAYEIDEVFHSAKHIGLPDGFVLQYIQPLWYEIDQHLRVMDPLGLTGKRLEGKFHLIALSDMVLKHLKAAFRKSSIQIGSFIVKPLTLEYEPWKFESKSVQKLVISLEENQCQVAILEHDTCRFVASHAMGEVLLDRDLMACVGITLEDARKIRLEFPSLSASQLMRRQSHGYDLQLVSEVLQARVSEMSSELYQLVSEQIRWDLPLSIEVKSQAMEHYWRPWLMRHFPNAQLSFHNTALTEDAQSWIGFEAIERYIIAQSGVRQHEVNGWRARWTKCKNWIEYHL